jgi:hypothetical protein
VGASCLHFLFSKTFLSVHLVLCLDFLEQCCQSFLPTGQSILIRYAVNRWFLLHTYESFVFSYHLKIDEALCFMEAIA